MEVHFSVLLLTEAFLFAVPAKISDAQGIKGFKGSMNKSTSPYTTVTPVFLTLHMNDHNSLYSLEPSESL